MKTACIVQARIGSTRLPGKVLLPLNGHTVIAEVLKRCMQIPGVDEVICAVPDTKANNRLAKVAGELVRVVRGPEHDVLARYAFAAEESRADIVMRVTGDCPLISPGVCGFVLQALVSNTDVEFASNVEQRSFPQGYDCEVFTSELLMDADISAGPKQREHVTTWMYNDTVSRAILVSPCKMDGRLTLDTEDDYKVICAAFGHEPYAHRKAA